VILVAGLVFFADPIVWNADFVRGLAAAGVPGVSGEAHDAAAGVWRFVQRMMPAVVAVLFLIDLAAIWPRHGGSCGRPGPRRSVRDRFIRSCGKRNPARKAEIFVDNKVELEKEGAR